MNESTSIYERTLYEARLDADYEVRLSELHARFYRRIRTSIIFVSLLAGSTALVAAVGTQTWVTGASGLVVAAVTFLDVAFDFAGKAASHDAQRKRYLSLLRAAPSTLRVFDRTLRLIAFDDPGCIEGLRAPAFNDNLRSHGRTDYELTLSRWQRFMSALA